MKNMNVGLLILSCGWGGAEEMVYQMAKKLINQNMDVSLFINDELKSYYSDIPGISIYPLGSINRANRLFTLYSCYKIWRNLTNIVPICQPNLIHVHLDYSFLVYYVFPNKFNIPTIATLHGLEIREFLARKLPSYWLVKKMFENTKIVTSVSQWQIENLEAKYKSKIIIIPNGVNTDEFKPTEVKKEYNVILFVGRLIESKGILELLEVAKELPEYEFWFAGRGPLEKRISLPNTKHLGFKTRRDLIEIYNKVTICCFPSHNEAFGIVGLETMACGKPIIATKHGFSEFIENGKNGLIIEPNDNKELKAAITKLMKDAPLRKNLGSNARKTALNFDWGGIVRKYQATYSSMLSR
jgi:phosphatidyl-myo-inositol alpha-mannosyltransferase